MFVIFVNFKLWYSTWLCLVPEVWVWKIHRNCKMSWHINWDLDIVPFLISAKKWTEMKNSNMHFSVILWVFYLLTVCMRNLNKCWLSKRPCRGCTFYMSCLQVLFVSLISLDEYDNWNVSKNALKLKYKVDCTCVLKLIPPHGRY